MAIKLTPPEPGPAALIARITESLLAAYPDRIRSVYLLGSRASGSNLDSSDIDLGLVFKGSFSLGQRNEIWSLVKAVADGGPLLVDLVLLDDHDLERGVRPYAKNGRLLAGADALAACRLLPEAELVAHYGYSGLYYLWLARGKPGQLTYPLDYPDGRGEFRGYDAHGVWIGRSDFAAGFNTWVNLVTSLAGFRLGARRGEFVPSKARTAERYRACWPDDPWTEFLADAYRWGRVESGGRVPAEAAARRRLRDLCGRTLEFENEFLDECIRTMATLNIPDNPELCARLGAYIIQLRTDSPEHARALDTARRRLGGLEALPER